MRCTKGVLGGNRLLYTFTDDYNRANGTLEGPDWNVSATVVNIVSNEVEISGPGRLATHERPMSNANHYVEIDIVSGSGTNRSSAMVRKETNTATDDSYYHGTYDFLAAAWRIWQKDVTTTVLVSTAGSAPSLPFRIRLEAETSGANCDLRLYEIVGGSPTLRASVTDTTSVKTSRYVGVYGQGTSLHDNFECGPL
ncbi:MAG: hypothetical protein WBM50_13640 [Acidimicrobiales bacterium]